jgi:uncharacterized metal-binding protein YceD (DUF177 family)
VKKKDISCIVPFAILKNGEHSYLFSIEKEVFTENNYTDIHHCDLKAHITFNKNSPIISVNFHLYGTVNVTCDRCGDDFDMHINLDKKLLVRPDGIVHTEEDDMITLGKDEVNFDILPYIYQYIVLSLPMQRVHPADKDGVRHCNTEVLNKLKHLEVKKSNDEQYIQNAHLKVTHLREKQSDN